MTMKKAHAMVKGTKQEIVMDYKSTSQAKEFGINHLKYRSEKYKALTYPLTMSKPVGHCKG